MTAVAANREGCILCQFLASFLIRDHPGPFVVELLKPAVGRAPISPSRPPLLIRHLALAHAERGDLTDQ